jgi:group I intron endonuclease
MEVYGIVYEMTNIQNNRVYIGQTTRRIVERFYDHIKGAHRKDRLEKTRLEQDINIYGKKAFVFKTLTECYTKRELDLAETFYIKKYKSLYKEDCYNSRLGLQLSDDAKRKLSEALKGHPAWNKNKICPQFAGKNNGMYGKKGYAKTSKKVKMIKDGLSIEFLSMGLAIDYLKIHGWENASSTHISACCLGKRKSIYGYKWTYVT